VSNVCVNCKCEIHGQAYDSESFVGSWCSATCKEAFDDMREEAYARKKGDLPADNFCRCPSMCISPDCAGDLCPDHPR
jgi:YHS domain-containing protein